MGTRKAPGAGRGSTGLKSGIKSLEITPFTRRNTKGQDQEGDLNNIPAYGNSS